MSTNGMGCPLFYRSLPFSSFSCISCINTRRRIWHCKRCKIWNYRSGLCLQVSLHCLPAHCELGEKAHGGLGSSAAVQQCSSASVQHRPLPMYLMFPIVFIRRRPRLAYCWFINQHNVQQESGANTAKLDQYWTQFAHVLHNLTRVRLPHYSHTDNILRVHSSGNFGIAVVPACPSSPLQDSTRPPRYCIRVLFLSGRQWEEGYHMWSR